jgi:PleD family two-component response regulator
VWAYAYQIVPPQSKRRLEAIRDLLDHEHAAARTAGRTWASRVVLERRATRILIVSDSPDQERAVDEAMAAELERQRMVFTRTPPMEILAAPEPTNPSV